MGVNSGVRIGQYECVFGRWKRSPDAPAAADDRPMMRVGIAGAGAVGRSVAQELIDYGHKVLLIEHNVRHYEPHTVPSAEWLLADACELSSLEESGLQMCDVVIAATGDDKVNLAASFLAKTEFGVSRVVARVNDLRNEWLFTEAWGVDVAVSAPSGMVAAIEGAIDIGHVVRLMQLRQGQVSMAKLTLPEGDSLVGRRIRDLPMPDNTMLAVVVRDNGIVLPQPDDVLEAGDEMLFFAGGAGQNEVSALVQGAIKSKPGDEFRPPGGSV